MNPGLAIGDLVLPAVVIHGPGGRELRPLALAGASLDGCLETGDELLVGPGHLARLRADGVTAVDMEASAVGLACERFGLPWSVYRGISDRLETDGVDYAIFGLARMDGSPNAPAIARFVLTKPWRIPQLARLGRGTTLAAAVAARAALEAVRRHRFALRDG